MKTWLAIWKLALFEQRALRYVALAWLFGAPVWIASLWPGLSDWNCCANFSNLGRSMLGTMLPLLGVGTFALFIRSVNGQLSPRATQLVPGLRQSAIVATLVLWLVIGAGLSLQTCVYGVRLPLIGATILFALAAGVSISQPMQSLVLVLPIVLLGPNFGLRVFPFTGDTTRWTDWLLVPVAIAMGAGWIALQLGARAERRELAYTRAQRRKLRDQDMGLQPWSRLLRKSSVQQWLLDRVVRARSPEARVVHGLGPEFHWSQASMGTGVQTVFVWAFMCAFMCGGYWLLPGQLKGELKAETLLHPLSSIPFFFAALLGEVHLRELCARRKEEALLLLLPGAPHGKSLNRWLMRTLLVRQAVAVAIAMGWLAALLLLFGVPLELVLKRGTPPFAAGLLAAPVVLRNYATLRPPPRLYSVLLTLGLQSPLIFGIELRAIRPVGLMLMALGLSTILVAWRYRRLLDAPPAFPVGRLAE